MNCIGVAGIIEKEDDEDAPLKIGFAHRLVLKDINIVVVLRWTLSMVYLPGKVSIVKNQTSFHLEESR
jgi:hypothetical protein